MLKDFIKEGKTVLSSLYEEAEAQAIVTRLCSEILLVAPYAHILDPTLEIPSRKEQTLKKALSSLAGGEPLQYVLGYADFCGLRFRVTPAVLIPRPETEQLCRIVLETVLPSRDLRILDLCTGSGCIAWTLACSLPGARVLGVDISAEALEVASSQNPGLPQGCNAPSFHHCDVLSGSDAFTPEGEFDVIVSNPPYVRESEKALMHSNVLEHEPGLALFVDDGDPLLFYRAIADFAKKRLRRGGFGAVEINEAFGEGVRQIFLSSGMSKVETVEDFRAKIRFVTFKKP